MARGFKAPRKAGRDGRGASAWSGWLLAALILGGSGGAFSNTAPLPAPTVVAQRAIVVDALTGQALYEKNADSKALQGSIAKIMTAHVALWAVQQGHVSLQDQVQISERAQEQACTCMLDMGGNKPQVGEIFFLQDLLYASLGLSMGEPTDAIAEHVAAAVVLGTKTPAATKWESERRMNLFLELMNDHVAHLGLTQTRFVTVHGGDACDFAMGCFIQIKNACTPQSCATECPLGDVCKGGTTVRELVRVWQHAAGEHPLFLTIAGTRTRAPMQGLFKGATNNYPFTNNGKWFGYYPGVDGDKNGGSALCGVCWLAQATRNGRTLIAAHTQSDAANGAGDIGALLRYGFAKAFSPDRQADSGGSGGGVSDLALGCFSDGTAVTAARTPIDTLGLKFWFGSGQAGGPGGIGVAASWPTFNLGRIAPGAISDVDVTLMRTWAFVTAVVNGGAVEVRSWTYGATPLPNSGKITLLDTSDAAGAGQQVKLLRLNEGLFVLGVRNASGALRIQSWSLGEDGALALLDDSAAPDPFALAPPQVADFDLAGGATALSLIPGFKPSSYQVVAATRDQATQRLRLHAWSVKAADGGVVALGDSGNAAGTANNVSLARTGFGQYATAVSTGTAGAGNAKVIFWSVSGGTVSRTGDTDAADYVSDTASAGMGFGGTGVVTALRDGGNGDLLLVAWDLAPSNPPDWKEGPKADLRLADSGNLAGYIDRLDLCRISGAASGGDYVTAVRTASGELKLIRWQVGAKGGALAAPEPPSTPDALDLARALDRNANGVLDDAEVIEAVALWVRGEAPPETGQPLGDDEVLALVRLWVTGRPF